MDTEPAGAPDLEPVQHRIRRQSFWQQIPFTVKVALAICLGLLAISLAAQDRIIAWFQSRSPAKATPVAAPRIDAGTAFDEVAANLNPGDLELVNTELNSATHRIEGAVQNRSQRAYTDVRITFVTIGSDLIPRGPTSVTVPKLAAGGQAAFVSEPLAAGSRQWSLRGIAAKPVRQR